MPRLNQERQKELEPQRIAFAKDKIEQLGFDITYEDTSKIQFLFKNKTITFFPYSGWYSGKGIKPGRGLNELIKQLK
ncbi:hypothetical protein J2X97_000379 [Epilithonimonas hungarica]|uniref:hypothetical protein n=1 Tax=Epilithonimonas hungarica TaxID=454006 RepID=UPI0027871B03|nr:hypothetical protein [Epilithonimonas hungarica]MDP9954742.1 hypothetical protein [Epilithonimonas hungarica]